MKSEIDNENVNTYDLQEIIEQLFNPSPEYELHVSIALSTFSFWVSETKLNYMGGEVRS